MHLELEEIMLMLEDAEATVYPSYESALVGYTCGWGNTVAVYEWGKCIEILMNRDGMTYEDAVEFFDHNTAGAYVGEGTPTIVNTGYVPRVVPKGYMLTDEKSEKYLEKE